MSRQQTAFEDPNKKNGVQNLIIRGTKSPNIKQPEKERIRVLIDKIARKISLSPKEEEIEPTPDQLAEQIEQIMQPIGVSSLPVTPAIDQFANEPMSTRPRQNYDVKIIKKQGTTFMSQENESALNLLATATRIGKYISGQKLKQTMNDVRKKMAVVDQAGHLQRMYNSLAE